MTQLQRLLDAALQKRKLSRIVMYGLLKGESAAACWGRRVRWERAATTASSSRNGTSAARLLCSSSEFARQVTW